MKMLMNATLVAGLLAATTSVQAQETLYGITDTGTLFRFQSNSPGTQNTVGAVTGLSAGHALRSIDFRPATGGLYALSTSTTDPTAAQLYLLDLATGAATPLGTGFTLADNTSGRVSIDFNPTVDRVRIVTGSGQSYRANPINGAFVARDTNLAFNPGSGAGTPFISGVAYSNNFPNGGTTTLYGYDYLNDQIVTIGGLNSNPSPNGGVLFPVGSTGLLTDTASIGFDISSATGTAFLNADLAGSIDRFYQINLATGTAIDNGSFGIGVLSISTVIPAPSAAAVAGLGLLVAARRRR